MGDASCGLLVNKIYRDSVYSVPHSGRVLKTTAELIKVWLLQQQNNGVADIFSERRCMRKMLNHLTARSLKGAVFHAVG